MLLRAHLRRQLASGRKGAATLLKLTYLSFRVVLGGVFRFALLKLSRLLERITPGFEMKGETPDVAPAT